MNVIDDQSKSILKTIEKFKGALVKQKIDHSLVSFTSVTKAVSCALEIQEVFKPTLHPHLKLQIGLGAGVPVSEKEGFFEDTIQTAKRLCDIVEGQVVLTSEVRELYESENLSISGGEKYITMLNASEEKFLNLLMDYMEQQWNKTTLNADDFTKCLGYSRSQLYRKMVSITGKSPNNFIREYRLSKALHLLNKRIENISEIAFETGFSSPAYFSKCFHDSFGILPSHYIKSFRP